MRILGLLLIPFFLFAQLVVDTSRHIFFNLQVPLKTVSLTTYGSLKYAFVPVTSSKAYSYNFNIVKEVNYSWTCIKKNLGEKWGKYYYRTEWTTFSWSPVYSLYYINNLGFCKNKSGFVYSAINNAWYPISSDSNSTPICPGGKIWSANKQQCLDVPKCNLTCSGAGKILDSVACVCKCAPALTSSGSECVPNTNLNQAACEKAGGIYLDKIPVTGLFSDPKYAYLVMQVPLFSSHLCYTQNWLNTKLGKIKNALSPKKVLTAAIGLLPLGKINYVWRGAELAEDIKDMVKNPKVLQDQKPIINTNIIPIRGYMSR